MECAGQKSMKMVEIKTGGRPPNTKIKFILRGIMQEIGVADVNFAQKRFTKTTGLPANHHTIKKYLDQLVYEGFLRVQVVRDNIRKIENGYCSVRRRVFLYRVNTILHTADKAVD